MLSKNLFFYNFVLISLFISSCSDIYAPGDEPRHEKLAEQTITSMINNQKNYFLKHEKFLKLPDRPLKSNLSFFNSEKCYGYYSKTVNKIKTNFKIDGIYSYAMQEACGGNWGIDLSHYLGGVFAIPIKNSKDIKVVSIVCTTSGPAYNPLQYLPDHVNGLVNCPSNTEKVYSNIEIIKNQ